MSEKIDTDDNIPNNTGEDVTDIGSQRELFIDEYLLERTDGANRRLHNPVRQEVALYHDEPWEGNMSGYYTIIEEPDRYRLYYFTRQWDHGEPGENFQCYAESEDGRDWYKPPLGQHEYEGSLENNIVLCGREAATFTPFKDHSSTAGEPARYKAVAASEEGLVSYQSPDGIDWSLIDQEPLFTRDEGAFDSQNLAFWDPVRDEYRVYFRYFDEDRRGIKTATSTDFEAWTDPVPLEYEDATSEQYYTNVVKPYYRAPHLFIGFPMRYVERNWDSPSMRHLPGWVARQERERQSHRYGSALTDSLLMTSRDGVRFYRHPKAFLSPGLWETASAANWIYGDNMLSWHVLETPSPVNGKPPELSFYGNENYWVEGTRTRRYSLRVDGFVSMEAPRSGGDVITKPITFDGKDLFVNFSTSAAGTLKIELQRPNGTPYDGFSLAKSDDLFGDDLDRRVSWSSTTPLAKLRGQPIRVRFHLVDAHLYSFQFR